ncbi:hypothetical protein HaLaN_07710, partial [Haematococcus lacustris]
EGEVVGQVASDQHAGEGVHGQADQAGPGCRGGGHELNTVTPPQEPFGPEPLNGLQGVPAQDPNSMEEALTAEALVAAAKPGADPLPKVVWSAFSAKGRCLEDLYKSFIQELGLGGCEAGPTPEA